MWAFLTSLLQYGTAPALLVVAGLIVWLSKKIDKNGEGDAARSKELQKAIADLSASTEARFAEQAAQIADIQRDYLLRKDHYKDIGGWRTDLNQMRSDLGAELRGVREEISTINTNLIHTVLKGVQNGS